MNIQLSSIGKRYRYEWIFRQLSFQFSSEMHYAVTGPNGSGKSTLMNVISGYLSPSSGSITYYFDDKAIEMDDLYQYLSFCAPYIDLVEDFTLEEMIDFHYGFKTMLISKSEMYALLGFKQDNNAKYLKHFSSGMKQKLKLALSICADTRLLLLDEPTITLDKDTIDWYHELMQKFMEINRTVIISSNVESDFLPDTQRVNIIDFK